MARPPRVVPHAPALAGASGAASRPRGVVLQGHCPTRRSGADGRRARAGREHTRDAGVSRGGGAVQFALFVPTAAAALPLAELLTRWPIASTIGGPSARRSIPLRKRRASRCESHCPASRSLTLRGRYEAGNTRRFCPIPPQPNCRALPQCRCRSSGARSATSSSRGTHGQPLCAPKSPAQSKR